MTRDAAGISALQLAVPAVDTILEELRPLLPSGTAVLDPAHISFGYPWIPPTTARAVIDDVADALAREAPFDVELTGPRRFPTDTKGRITVWLDPQPRSVLRALNRTISDASGHDVADLTPHCSLVRVGRTVDPSPFEAVVRARLPLTTRLDRVDFHVREGNRWRVERTMPLGPGPP